MNSMNMKTSEKPNGRPKGSKNKPTPKFKAPRAVDLVAKYQQEIAKLGR